MTYKINTKIELEEYMCRHWNDINQWIDEQQDKLPQPITSSVDVRESKTKFAPVDHNMYPAGFNNICSKDLVHCADHFKKFFEAQGSVKRIGLLPESHTKNKFYLDHLHKLRTTLEMTGVEVIIFSPDKELFQHANTESIELESQSGHKIVVYQAQINDGFFFKVGTSENFNFDLIILNHDQSNPLPIEWSLVKTPVLPTPFAGWYRRQKNHHFKCYQEVANQFAERFNINPDLIQAQFVAVDHLNFNTKEGMDVLADEVDKLLSRLAPGSSVFVKASQGTYGMGISVVSSGDEIRTMNRKIRNKMDVGKNNLKFTSVLVQEGIETILKCDDAPAEVTIYLINGKSAGGFMRSNPLKGTQANLNSQGMVYQKLCFSDVKQDYDHKIKEAVYSVIARLSVLAASMEMKDLMESV
jgi:glutamate--cysteine ligase